MKVIPSSVWGGSGFSGGGYSSYFESWNEKTLKAKYNIKPNISIIIRRRQPFAFSGRMDTLTTLGIQLQVVIVSCPCNQGCCIWAVQRSWKTRKQLKELWEAMKYLKRRRNLETARFPFPLFSHYLFCYCLTLQSVTWSKIRKIKNYFHSIHVCTCAIRKMNAII